MKSLSAIYNQTLPETWVEVPFEVQRLQDGQRVDAYLAFRLHRYSRSEVKRLIEAGRVFLRGRAVKPAAKVAAGEIVLIRYPKREEAPCPHDALAVVYEDEDLLAVNKPGGVLSHPTDKVIENTATTILRRQFPKLKLHLLHRLDRETSGVLLLAKNPAAARTLTNQFSRRQVEKEYLAIVAGKVSWKTETVALPLGKEGLEIAVRQAAGEGRPAVTEFKTLSAGEKFSLVSAKPRTGRLHQIRVHLASLGHPVAGDKLYTGAGELYLKAVRRELTPQDLESLGARRQMLHAWRLELKSPDNDRTFTITAEPPQDFTDLLAASRLALPDCARDQR